MKVKKLDLDFDGKDCFVVADGVRIAKRGTGRHADTWISLEPGWTVLSPKNHEYIEVAYKGVRVQ